MFVKSVVQAMSPSDSQFSVDVDDVDTGGYCLPQIFIVGARSAV
jgi:hypothetical protein